MSRFRDRRGASLFELVMVILIIGAGVVPILGAYREAARQGPRGELQTRAAFLAAEKMEEILADRHSPSRGFAWLLPASYPAETAIAGFPGFRRDTAVGPDVAVDGVTVRPVTVSVSHALAATVTVTTWFAEAGP